MQCNQCQREVGDHAVCPYCHHPIRYPAPDHVQRYDSHNSHYADDRDNIGYRQLAYAAHRQQPPKKKKTALIISVIALVLVIAIVGGGIFYFSKYYVSAAELQAAKDAYTPPAQAFQIDRNAADPSNKDIRFQYDSRSRIIACSYTVKEKTYDQEYTYDDSLYQVVIDTMYKGKKIIEKIIEYTEIPEADVFVDVDGYYIRIDEDALDKVTPEPTEPPEIVDAADTANDEALISYLKRITLSMGDQSYDCRHATESETNILQKVCYQFSCIDWTIYPGNDPIDNGNPLETHTVYCDRQKTEWICKNIFNITDEDIEALYTKSTEDTHYTRLWKEETDNGDFYYCYTFAAGKGGPDIPIKITDVKTDGRFYYITYGQQSYDGQILGDPMFTVMEKKNIDSKDYWSMYTHTSEVPETIEHFDPQG